MPQEIFEAIHANDRDKVAQLIAADAAAGARPQ